MNNTDSIQNYEISSMRERVKRIENLLVQIVDEIHNFQNDLTEEAAAANYKANYVYEEGEPEYGTKEWWEWSHQQAEEDHQNGSYTTITTEEELKAFFDTL